MIAKTLATPKRLWADLHAVDGATVGTCAAFDAAGRCRRQSSSLEGRARPGTPDGLVTHGLPCAESPRRR